MGIDLEFGVPPLARVLIRPANPARDTGRVGADRVSANAPGYHSEKPGHSGSPALGRGLTAGVCRHPQ
jgi:hypothetical protein